MFCKGIGMDKIKSKKLCQTIVINIYYPECLKIFKIKDNS